MKTIDEMLHLALLTPDQHNQVSAWIAQADSPEEILKMPPALWRAIERASEVMGIDDDLLRPPALDADGVHCTSVAHTRHSTRRGK
ncbi:MAG: hypothetical protein Q7U45_01880 [Burkholderiaceae bacterium]|nr:hypothetical protein [Burkholderiaceae bacterium]MDP3132480.1 hypothetical protein [Burkholderiaceae bacterium]